MCGFHSISWTLSQSFNASNSECMFFIMIPSIPLLQELEFAFNMPVFAMIFTVYGIFLKPVWKEFRSLRGKDFVILFIKTLEKSWKLDSFCPVFFFRSKLWIFLETSFYRKFLGIFRVFLEFSMRKILKKFFGFFFSFVQSNIFRMDISFQIWTIGIFEGVQILWKFIRKLSFLYSNQVVFDDVAMNQGKNINSPFFDFHGINPFGCSDS